MKINTQAIIELKPCKPRLVEYLQHHCNFDVTLEDLLASNKISYEDKFWVFNRLVNKKQYAKWIKLSGHSFWDEAGGVLTLSNFIRCEKEQESYNLLMMIKAIL